MWNENHFLLLIIPLFFASFGKYEDGQYKGKGQRILFFGWLHLENLSYVSQHELNEYSWWIEGAANLNSFSPSTIRLWARALWLASADRRLIFMALKVEMHRWNSRYTTPKLSIWDTCEGEEEEGQESKITLNGNSSRAAHSTATVNSTG